MSASRWLRAIDIAGIAAVMVVTFWSLHPSLLFSTSLITGGDTGAHVAAADFLRTNGLWHLTPWYPGWFDGMPLYTFYFVLPDALAVLGSILVPFTISFKLMTALGSLLLPLGAFVMARQLRAPRPIPLALAMATLPFLFDANFTIDGGNLFSTMAGEYAFSLSLALALVAIGYFARGMRTGRGYRVAAVALAATQLAHLLPWLFAIVVIGIVMVLEVLARHGWGDPTQPRDRVDRTRPIRFSVVAGLFSLGFTAWWFAPFATLQNYTNSMGYTNDDVSSLHAIFSFLGWFTATGGASSDRWVLVLAGLGFVAAWWSRQLLGVTLALWCVVSLAAFVYDPQSVIWNERLVPFWYLGTHLLAGWFVGYVLWRWCERAQRRRHVTVEAMLDGEGEDLASEDATQLRATSVEWLTSQRHRSMMNASVAVLTLGLASTVPGLIPQTAAALHLNTSGNEVTSWSAFNYAGYQGQAAWPEYHDLMSTMASTAHRYGCGRAMWEYDSGEQRFGTPMALMLLPYWTHNCVQSMEGLFFESSATTPYHFLNQAELSSAPSNPQVGLTYGLLNVALGVQHLEMLGVKYYIAFSANTLAQAQADPALQLVAQTKAWPSPGVRWSIFLIKDSPLVTGLRHLPTVVAPAQTSRVNWLAANEPWWLVKSDWSHLLAASGPPSWPRVGHPVSAMQAAELLPVRVSQVHQSSQQLDFSVDRLGVPVEVKISYFPRWHVTGATGPYRVSPNMMVVVPTSHHVTLSYGATTWQTTGDVITASTVVLCACGIVQAFRRRR
jgi:hypothetical protein